MPTHVYLTKTGKVLTFESTVDPAGVETVTIPPSFADDIAAGDNLVIGFAPDDPTDWDAHPATIESAVNELADRVRALEP